MVKSEVRPFLTGIGAETVSGGPRTSLLAPFWLSLGTLWPPFGRRGPLFSASVFLSIFDGFSGSGRGGPGGGTTLRGTSTGVLRFLTFGSKTRLAPCVFDVFRFSGFPVPVRERLPPVIYLSRRYLRQIL